MAVSSENHLLPTAWIKRALWGAVLGLYEFPFRCCGPEESRGKMVRTARIEKERPKFAGALSTSALHGTKKAKFAHNTWWGRRQWESENCHSPPKRYQWCHAQQGKLFTPPPQRPPQTYKAFTITNLARPSQVPSDKLIHFHSEKSFAASRHCEHRVQMVGSDRAYMVSIIRNVFLWTSFTYYIFLHC